ncbi:hypothetical protein D3C81_1575510 [compost metagenome]
MHRIGLQQHLAPGREGPQQAAGQPEQPVHEGSQATGTVHRSHQAKTAQQRQASPLHQTQTTGAEAYRIFKVIGNAQGQGACDKHSKKQGAWAGQRHGVSVTIKSPAATVVESAQPLQGGQMQTFQQLRREIPTDIRGSDEVVCRTLLNADCEGRIPTGSAVRIAHSSDPSRSDQPCANTGSGAASKRSSSKPRPSWNSWLLRSVSPICASRRASSAQASGLR